MPSVFQPLFSRFRGRNGRTGAVDAGRTAIIWWGSLRRGGGATIGDLFAVDNLSAELDARGLDHTILTSRDLAVPGHVPIGDLSAVGQGIETIVFVCGPIVENRRLAEFLAFHRSARKLAVGVSVLPSQSRMTAQFDVILARDGFGRQSFDLAISDIRSCEPPANGRRLKFALCYRGKQKEYGTGMADAVRAEGLLDALAREIPADLIRIDTVLRPGNSARDIESQFQSSDIVLTTRLHGSLFGLANGKPVIAIDQIKGSGKVKPVLDRIGWPAAFSVDQSDSDTLSKTLRDMVTHWPVKAVSAAQTRIASEAKAAVTEAATLVEASAAGVLES